MRISAFILSVLFSFSVQASDKDSKILQVRKLFYLSAENSGKSAEFLDLMEGVKDDSSGVQGGYLAMAYMLKAKHSWNPYQKLKYFVRGRDLLEKQIMDHKKSTELVFLRYCVQSNAPFFLGYSSKIQEDKIFIVKHYNNTLDEDLRWRIKKYFIDSKDLTKEEKQKISKELWTTM